MPDFSKLHAQIDEASEDMHMAVSNLEAYLSADEQQQAQYVVDAKAFEEAMEWIGDLECPGQFDDTECPIGRDPKHCELDPGKHGCWTMMFRQRAIRKE